ncbi:hypothetical protein BDR06DRAFT_889405, partial [Suillus hirtellus]
DLKNCKWFEFDHDRETQPGPGNLALFCPSCPQPGINMPSQWEEKYERQIIIKRFVVDGNFTIHMNIYMVTEAEYQAHLTSATESRERSACSNHQAVNAVNINQSNLQAIGVGATAYAQYGCFVSHSIVDFQKGKW